MKRFTVIVITLMLLASSASAIIRVQDTWDYGVKGGLTLAEHYGCSDCEEDMKLGFVGGVFGEYKASPKFSIQPELLFVMKGWEVVGNKISLDYIEFPVLAKLKIPGSGAFSPHFYAGPAGAILVNADLDGIDMDDFFQSLDFGFAFGIGADIVAGTGKFTIDARYTLGLTGIIDNEELWELLDPFNDIPDIKNAAISISIGFGW